MLDSVAGMDANASAFGAIMWFAGKTIDMVEDRQDLLKTWGIGQAHAVEARGYSILPMLQGVACEGVVNQKTTGENIALRLISLKTNIHDFFNEKQHKQLPLESTPSSGKSVIHIILNIA